MKKMYIRATLQESILGTLPSNPELYATYVASKAPDAKTFEEEVATLGTEAVYNKGMTVFAKNDGKPFVYDYLIKGFFKNACSAMREVGNSESSKLKNYKKRIDNLVFVQPRCIAIQMSEGAEIGVCERPLRASTPQGERVGISCSEEIPAGSVLEFTILLFRGSDEKLVTEWLNYGAFNGLGQWHNSGKGRFSYEILKVEDDGKDIVEEGEEQPKKRASRKKKADAATEEAKEEATETE